LTRSMRNWAGLIKSWLGQWGLDRQLGYYINDENDQVDTWDNDDKFKEYLQFLRQLYEEKLIEQEVLTQASAQFAAKMAEGTMGLFFNQASDTFTQWVDSYEGITPLKGPHGDQLFPASPVARDFGTFAITSVNSYPAET